MHIIRLPTFEGECDEWQSRQPRRYRQLILADAPSVDDWFIGLDFYAPVEQPDKTKPLHGENQWPPDEAVPGFRDKYERWIEKMKKLGIIVMEA